MKWPLFLIAGVAALMLLRSPAAAAEAVEAMTIESISHGHDAAGGESLTFLLSAPGSAKIFTLPGEKPRLVLDFPQTVYGGKSQQALAGSRVATAFRTAVHRQPALKTRVVVDFLPEAPLVHRHEYFDEGRRLVVHLGEAAPALPPSPATAPPPVAPEPAVASPLPASVLARPAAEASSAAAGEEGPGQSDPSAGGEGAELLRISFDDSSNRGEMVLFHLNDFYPPTVAAIEKDNPRVLCDFMGMALGQGVLENIVASGRYVKRIRAARHSAPDRIRVVIDLSPDRDYDLQQVFFKNDNLFVLIINELAPGQAGVGSGSPPP